ncbi:DDE-type integrase/transposase/recombinase [Candidatus Methanoperedens nitratireducens]|uniref:Transposase n=1 Tax=Candidatus Methanoperedens nitratireducens TaxID=1392998 RepID=A0A284VL02_9EURY|nr:DDE-type integrase/transposase/recombinase [Candidatus Methanoperedens nitroreducens]SNQ59903.1 transposase [Candidatus Methanoperedens nitroreducens]
MSDNTTNPQTIGTREDRGKAIAEKQGQILRINDKSYKVKSQSSETLYDVVSTEIGWKCSCPDHQTRGVKCKHIYAVEFSFNLREQVKKSVTIQPVVISKCLYCHSTNIRKDGLRHNKSGDIQRFECLDCHKTFSINIGFEKMKHNPQAVTTAMQLYFSGESLRHTKESLKLLGVYVSHKTIHNWIEKYTTLMKQYVDKLKPDVGNTWRADEVFVKFSGNMKYLFALMDDETRYWIAQEVADTKYKHDARALFHKGKEIAGKRPNVLITDGLPSYHNAFYWEFYTNTRPQSMHINAIKLDGDMNNNAMERANGEVRDREKVMRGLKNKNTPILKGYQIFHNYMRPHEGLNGKTPAEACGIKVEGDNKWITLIQNASHKEHQKNNGVQ